MQTEIKAYPLNNTEYYAEDLKKWNYIRTTGVFSVDSNLQTISSNNMSVTVKAGIAFLNDGTGGLAIWTSKDEVLKIDPADGVLNRIDAISLAYDKPANKTYLRVVRGTPASIPSAPTIQRNSSIYEIFIATIYINKGVTSITSAVITDTRLNTQYCGLVRDGIEKIPTEMIQAQYDELMVALNKAIKNAGQALIVDGSITKEKLDSTLVPQCITVGTTTYSNYNANTWYTLPTTKEWARTGTEISRGGDYIRIGKNISFVKVSAYVFFNSSSAAHNCTLMITKNDYTAHNTYFGSVVNCGQSYGSATYTEISLIEALISVTEGDKLYVRACCDASPWINEDNRYKFTIEKVM